MPTGRLHFTLDIAGDRELSRSMHGYLGRVTNLKPWFERIQADWSATMKLKFAAEGAHEGEAWQPLSAKHGDWDEREISHEVAKRVAARLGVGYSREQRPVRCAS